MRAWVAGCAVVAAVGVVLALGQLRADGAREVGAVDVVAAGVPTESLSAPGRSVAALTPLSRDERMARIIRAVWPDHLERTAIWVARCESHLNPRTINWSDRHSDGSRGSFGLFQVGALHRHKADAHGDAYRLLLPWTNARAALEVFRAQGWAAWWHCSRRVGAR